MAFNDERFAARLVFSEINNVSLVFVTFAPGVGFTADKDHAFGRFGFIAFATPVGTSILSSQLSLGRLTGRSRARLRYGFYRVYPGGCAASDRVASNHSVT